MGMQFFGAAFGRNRCACADVNQPRSFGFRDVNEYPPAFFGKKTAEWSQWHTCFPVVTGKSRHGDSFL
jgi:hypothetical protein